MTDVLLRAQNNTKAQNKQFLKGKAIQFRQEQTELNISRQSDTCAKLLIPTVPTPFSVVTHSCLSVNLRPKIENQYFRKAVASLLKKHFFT